MDKECSITFSTIKEGGATTAVTLNSGVNRHVTDEQWEEINNLKIVQKHLGTGVIVLRGPDEETISDSAAAIGTTVEKIEQLNSLEEYKVPQAIELINATHDVDVLKRWYAKTERISIRNEIQTRLLAIEEARA